MNKIQQKIWLIILIVVVIMTSIWTALTYYNNKTQEQYNEILQRYLDLNQVTVFSQQLIADLNNYLLDPSSDQLEILETSTEQVNDAKENVIGLGNVENAFELINFIHLVDSLTETTNRSISLNNQQDMEAATREFNEATRIANYISDTSLALVNKELNTYESFYRGIINQSENLNRLGIWLLISITFILLLVTYGLSVSITKPVAQLTEAANVLSNGHFDREITVESKDEIAFLAKTFNRMRININNLISEIHLKAQLEKELQENKLLLQESQLRSLQSQINPHFLFNTLNTVSKKAYLEGAEETSDLLVNIAGLLRYNLKRLDRSVKLFDELNVLRQYIDIQKARFTDRLDFYMDVDFDCLDIDIPALTLQPIIENAVIHAVEPKEEGGAIWFRIKDVDDHVQIEIEDDGEGMTKGKASQLLEGAQALSEGHSTGLGFTNVVKRLKLFYGQAQLVRVESSLGKGTKITLTIPKQKGEEQND